ncbi:MAG: hypothetical protein IPK93_05420 [Solirubrobacterales bacterium]|nr:hypothetical protein [Solirubrobacterales bacterium]
MSESSPSADVPKGSFAAGRRVLLPRGAELRIVVYVNGVDQIEGKDYTRREDEILFNRDIIKEQKSGRRKLIMLLGVVGFYSKNETVDIQFQRDGKTELASDLPIEH